MLSKRGFPLKTPVPGGSQGRIDDLEEADVFEDAARRQIKDMALVDLDGLAADDRTQAERDKAAIRHPRQRRVRDQADPHAGQVEQAAASPRQGGIDELVADPQFLGMPSQ